MGGVCRSKHVEQLRNIGIINSTTWLHLVGSFYEFYITMHGSMTIEFTTTVIPQLTKIICSGITFFSRSSLCYQASHFSLC